MLKPQDLLVTFKILSYEIGYSSVESRNHYTRETPWVIFEPISVYLRERDEVIVSDEPDDFETEELALIEQFILKGESETERAGWTYRKLAQQLFMSLSEVSQSIKRASKAGLLIKRGNKDIRVNKTALIDYVRFGAGVSFFVERGKVVRGIPTASAASLFKDIFASSSEFPTVWPCARGTVKGIAIAPIYKSVPKAVMIDPWLYKQLALLDIFRIGSAREKEEAMPYLTKLKGNL
ncbi:hypothetical protein M6C35_001919 [Vibrio metschnikovii]|nr:hypothetical protein [Vibrio metschnikovii]